MGNGRRAADPTPRYGRPPIGLVAAVASTGLRWGLFPVGVVLIALALARTGLVSFALLIPGAVIGVFGLFAMLAATAWARRGHVVMGFAFVLDEPEPVVRLDFRARTRSRPLRGLRTIEVREIAASANGPDQANTPRRLWLRLCFAESAGGRTTRYCLRPSELGATDRGALLAGLRRAVAGTRVEIRDVR